VNSREEVEQIIQAGGGLIARRDHPQLGGSLDWLTRRSELTPVLPGIYTVPELVADPTIRMRALFHRHPNAVLLRAAAARASFWPKAPMGDIEAAVPGGATPAKGYAFNRRRIPPDLIVARAGLRYSCPALTAIDLATAECADAIDNALRARAATLDGMYACLRLTPNRAGNRARRRLLIDSRGEPWSAAEREAHRLLHGARIEGWKSNWPVVLAGRLYYIDIAFRAQRLAVEIDGRLHETDEDQFQTDRWRQNDLILAGWRVIRFTWEMLQDHPEMVLAIIRRALRP
jgi:very-short-patch-repair endonuclease